MADKSQEEIRRYFLVAGVDYYWEGVSFAGKVATDRIGQILSATRARHVQIVMFNFESGEIKTIERGKSANSSIRESKPEKKFASISRRENYPKIEMDGEVTDNVFVHDGRHTMSIVDVYDAVFKLAQETPQSLDELSFFSHAYYDGPSLVNSFEYLRPSRQSGRLKEAWIKELASRDAFDRDPRASKDFSAPHLNVERKKLLTRAFTKTARVWVWGCNDDKRVLIPLQKTFQSPAFSWNGTGNDKVIRYVFTKDEAKKCYGCDPTGNFLPGDHQELTFSRTFKQLKAYAAALLQLTYAARFSAAAEVLALGALPGTFANYDRPPMTITADRKSVMRFFTNYLGVKLDDDGYRYAKFDPDNKG